jgi:UPF0271 protein
MLEERAITTSSGRRLPAAIDTICVHGDNPHAVTMAARLRQALEQTGCTLAPFPAFLRG